jgi:hypothetical protein
MERVLSDIRRDTEAARLNHPNPASSSQTLSNPSGSFGSQASTATSTASGSSPEAQRKAGAGRANGAAGASALGKGKAAAAGAGAVNGVVNGAGRIGEGSTGLAVPQTVIEEGVRITRECLEQVCEVDE